MQSSELQNLKWDYKFNSARHLQQITGAGFTFTPTLITTVHLRDTHVWHTQDQNEVCAPHRPEESTSSETRTHILLLLTPVFNFLLKIQQFKTRGKKIEAVEEEN